MWFGSDPRIVGRSSGGEGEDGCAAAICEGLEAERALRRARTDRRAALECPAARGVRDFVDLTLALTGRQPGFADPEPNVFGRDVAGAGDPDADEGRILAPLVGLRDTPGQGVRPGLGDRDRNGFRGPDGRLFVLIPEEGGDVVALLDKAGRPSPGWPVHLPGAEQCTLLLPVADGSVRIACGVRGGIGNVSRAFALDANARSLPGWPVDIENGTIGTMVGDELVMLVNPLQFEGGTGGELWPVAMVVIGADGRARKGVDVPFACCESDWAIGPDGVAYETTYRVGASVSSVKTDVLAFDLKGPRPGWPVTIAGNASSPSFDAQARLYMVVGSPYESPARTVVLDGGGQILGNGSANQPIVSTGTWNGAAAWTPPGEPVVAADGTAFIVTDDGGGTTVLAFDPAGQPLAGWPYRSKLGMEWTGYCPAGDTGCGQWRTMPAVGSENLLFVLNAAVSASTGGSMVAIAGDGRVRAGWPVTLRRAGSMFWSLEVAPTGGVWALAIEPEKRGYSATVLAIAEDSTVLSTTTIVEP